MVLVLLDSRHVRLARNLYRHTQESQLCVHCVYIATLPPRKIKGENEIRKNYIQLPSRPIFCPIPDNLRPSPKSITPLPKQIKKKMLRIPPTTRMNHTDRLVDWIQLPKKPCLSKMPYVR